MSNLFHIQKKIKSVSVTTRITHALEIISTTQQYLYQELQADSLHYLQGIYNIFFELFHDPEHDIRDTNKKFISFSGQKKELWFVIGTDIGMCGDMNERISKYILKNFDTKGDALIVLGARLHNYLEQKLGRYILLKEKGEISVRDVVNSVRLTAKKVFDIFMRGSYQKLTMVYVKDPKEGVLDKVNVLPFKENYFANKKNVYTRKWNTKVKFPEAVTDLFPQYFECVLLSALINSKLGEHTIRRAMMHNATKNAEELLAEYKIVFNKIRQATITQEVTEIVVASKFKDKK